MDPKLAYWTAALFLMTAAVASALLGWREVRRGRIEAHRRWMNTAAGLVGVFVVSYVFKVILLGKEDLRLWSPASVTILRIHETIVLVMVLAGAAARILARRLRSPARAAAARRRHRWAGRTAAVASIFALLTAAIVLAGMYWRD